MAAFKEREEIEQDSKSVPMFLSMEASSDEQADSRSDAVPVTYIWPCRLRNALAYFEEEVPTTLYN
jgi:hypothetical protein